MFVIAFKRPKNVFNTYIYLNKKVLVKKLKMLLRIIIKKKLKIAKMHF